MHRLTKVFLMLAGVAMAGCVYSHPYDRYDSDNYYRPAPTHHHRHSEGHRHESSSGYWHDHDRREYRAYERERRHERSEEHNFNYYRR